MNKIFSYYLPMVEMIDRIYVSDKRTRVPYCSRQYTICQVYRLLQEYDDEQRSFVHDQDQPPVHRRPNSYMHRKQLWRYN